MSPSKKKTHQLDLATKEILFKEILAENERLQKLVNHLQQERQDFIKTFSVIDSVEHSVAPDVKPFQSNRMETDDSAILAEKERVLLPDNRPQSHIPRFRDEKEFFNSFRDSKTRDLPHGSTEESPIAVKRIRAESTIPEEDEPAPTPHPKREATFQVPKELASQPKIKKHHSQVAVQRKNCDCNLI